MQGDVVFGAAGVYPVTVPGPKWKSWLKKRAFDETLSRGPVSRPKESVWKLGLAGWKSKGIMIRSRVLVFRSSPSRRSGSLLN